jgi:hypothetical protein
MQILDFFKRWFRKSGNGQMARLPDPAPEMIPGLVRMIDQTREVEVDCDAVYALLDQYAEMVARGEDPTSLMPLVQQHLELCPDCREELEGLLQILRATG